MRYLKTNIFLIGLIAFICGALNSCVEQGVADIPTYLQIDSVQVETKSGQGSSSFRIPFIWVYADNNFLGGFPIGKKIPVTASGDVNIELRPGIYTNGAVTRTDVYFLMAPYKVTVEMKKTKTTHINPVFKYEKGVKFPLIEDFEEGNVFKEDFDDFSSTELQRIENTENVLEGNFSALLEVNAEDSINAVGQIDPVLEPLKGVQSIFCELNYKCSTDLLVGIAGINSLDGAYTQAKISLKPRDTYRKIYIDITPDLLDQMAQSVSLYFLASYNSEYENEIQKVYIDNVKILQY